MLRKYQIEYRIKNIAAPALVFLSLFLRMMPQALTTVGPIMKMGTLCNFLLVGAAIVLFLKRPELDSFSLAYFCFLSVRFLSNMVNGVDVFKSAWTAILAVAFFVILKWAAEVSWENFLDAILFFMLAALLINLLFMIQDPEGLFENVQHEKIHFLGNRNSIIEYGLSGVIAGYFKIAEKKGDKISFLTWIILWFIQMITFSLSKSLTSIVGLTLLLGYLLFWNGRRTSCFWSVYIFGAISIAFYFLIVQNQASGKLLEKILFFLEKSSSFAERMTTWRAYLKEIPNEMILGHGVLEQSALSRIFVGTTAATNRHAHNIFLNIAFQSGIAGLFAFLFLFVIIISKLKDTEDLWAALFVGVLLGVLLVMSQVEAYTIEFYSLILFIVYSYTRKSGRIYHE